MCTISLRNGASISVVAEYVRFDLTIDQKHIERYVTKYLYDVDDYRSRYRTQRVTNS